MLFFVFTAKGFEFNIGVITYATAFATAYIAATVFALYAVASGSLALTSLIISYSLILPTAYGLIFLNDPVSVKFCVGIVLLIISLFLMILSQVE